MGFKDVKVNVLVRFLEYVFFGSQRIGFFVDCIFFSYDVFFEIWKYKQRKIFFLNIGLDVGRIQLLMEKSKIRIRRVNYFLKVLKQGFK